MRIQPIFFDKNVRITLSNEFRTGQPESKLILTLCLPFECSKLQLHSEGRFYGFYGKFFMVNSAIAFSSDRRYTV